MNIFCHEVHQKSLFFIHPINISESLLSQERLEQVGCSQSEVVKFLSYLESKHRLHEKVKEEVAKDIQVELNNL